MTRRIRLDVQYVGTRYAGWQVQPCSPTIQGALEDALERVLQAKVRVYGSGRTDAGVHARGQVAHFDTESSLSSGRIKTGSNHFLPSDIRVLEARDAPASFHARRSALSKEYRYRIYQGDVMPPHLHPFALLVSEALDKEVMQRASARVLGTHDFASMRSEGSNTETTVRTVYRSEWVDRGAEMVYCIEADGFLYKMVRTIVGALLEIGLCRRSPESMEGLGTGEAFSRPGPVVAARGLHLWCVRYEGVAPERVGIDPTST